ncbi:MAG: hypothetical protein QOD99_1701 [Chthoniobacter sp.]|jgi:hypothetical protein|nr:hypothetical protein [Chthoniobacter sp.]
MKSLPAFLLSAILAALPAASALGYGNAGHEIVGSIAARLLAGTHAEAEMKKLLRPSEDLPKACTWADRTKLPDTYLSAEMKDYVAANPSHHKYHYCDVPFQEKTYHDGGTGTNPEDIVHTMKLCIAILRDPKAHADDPHHITPRIALLLLAHFTGDLHQPLHVGCSYMDKENRFVDPDQGGIGQPDAGANFFKLNKSMALHGYWDTIAVRKARDRAAGLDFASYLLGLYPPKPDWKAKGLPGTWPQQWATDTLQLAAQCYKDVKLTDRHTVPADDTHPAHDEWKATLPPGYDQRAADVVAVELTKGGFRLAELLKAIWP